MDFDVIIVGAGPGGTIAARDLAKAGLRVGLFDQKDKDNLSNPIVIEVERTILDETGVPYPEGDEKPYHQKRMRVFSPDRREVFTLEGEHPAIALRLDAFVKRLLGYAESAGAKFLGGRKAVGPVFDGNKVAGVEFEAGGSREEVTARLVIDASGFNAALVRHMDPDLGIGFRDEKRDVVIAENHFHKIDVEKARQAIGEGKHFDDEIWNTLSRYGNFSTEYSYLGLSGEVAYILLGRKADYDEAPIADVIDRFKEEQGYYAEMLYGGKGPIRVRRSWDRLVADGFMMIGEAACMVIPANGSGVGSAMYAGALAARTAARALADGDVSTESLWDYCYKYQSGRGATLACYDANKLVIDSITRDQIRRMMEGGALAAEDIWNGAVPKPITMSLGSIPGRLKGIVTNPDLIPIVITVGRSISQVKKLYAAYPKKYDRQALAAWKAKEQKIFGPLGG